MNITPITPNIKVSIIEDSRIHAEWLKAFLTDDDRLDIVSCDLLGHNGIHAAREHSADIVILDFQLKDMTGLEVARRIKSYNSHTKIFMITAHTEISIIERLIRDKNVDAIAIKGSPYLEDNLLSAIHHVVSGGNYIDSSLLGKLRESSTLKGVSTLTKREFEIFIQLNIGKTDHQIANDLYIEISHVRNIKSKIAKKIQSDNIDSLLTTLVDNIA